MTPPALPDISEPINMDQSQVAVSRFGRFKLDDERGELHGPDGAIVKLRPKTLAVLQVFLANAGRVLSKQDLMRAVWPNIHVGDDSLFQCIRELRVALGDEGHQLLKLISLRGYQFGEALDQDSAESAPAAPAAEPQAARKTRMPFGATAIVSLCAIVGLCAIIAFAVAATGLRPGILTPRRPTIAVTIDTSNAPQAASMASEVTDDVVEGLAKISTIRVLSPQDFSASPSLKIAYTPATTPDIVVEGRLQKDGGAWSLKAHATNSKTGEIHWSTAVSVATQDVDGTLQRSRLAGGFGHNLAAYLNTLLYPGERPDASDAQARAKIVVEQATAFIVQTSRERFATAQTMLENALAKDPDNVDLEAALAGHLLRGLQSSWYGPDESAAVEHEARSLLERALRAEPEYLPVVESYCRLLTATNHYVESLVACANALAIDPWDGLIRFNLGMDQVQLGHFAEALATFKEADRFDTPQVSRWTWLLGAGLALMLMDRDAEALPWLQRSLAITPGTGRTYILLAAAYQRLGLVNEAKAAMAKALQLRPGSSADNMPLPEKNVSALTIAATERITRAEIAAGLPEH
jgi:DNA-binding winged helix-turn-helix (wHTH) protein/tetratricopeptide (TPR) repeat protein